MSALDLLEDGFPHGTIEGYAAGCRQTHCPAGEDFGISCTTAHTRYAGDYRFKKRVDAGMSVAEIAAAELADVEAQRVAAAAVRAQERAAKAPATARPSKPARVPRVVKAERVVKPKPARAVKAAVQKRPKGPRPIQHGTVYGATRCKTVEGCPNHATGLPTCVEVRREYNREYAKKRAATDGLAGTRGGTVTHGTATGYQMGCRKRSECPGGVDGLTCPDASLGEERRRRREAGIAVARPVVESAEVVRHLARLRAYGMGAVTIARATGVSKTGVRSFIYGREDYTPTGFGPRHGVIPDHIDAEKASKLLAFKPWVQS